MSENEKKREYVDMTGMILFNVVSHQEVKVAGYAAGQMLICEPHGNPHHPGPSFLHVGSLGHWSIKSET